MTLFRTFKWLSVAILAPFFATGPALAAGPASCPAFTSAMIDAALLPLGIGFSDPAEVVAQDDADGTLCMFQTDPDRGNFIVSLQAEEGAEVNASPVEGDQLSISVEGPFTRREARACRNEILNSFVWNAICEPALE